jgi:dipeptide/tripeptide permease
LALALGVIIMDYDRFSNTAIAVIFIGGGLSMILTGSGGQKFAYTEGYGVRIAGLILWYAAFLLLRHEYKKK